MPKSTRSSQNRQVFQTFLKYAVVAPAIGLVVRRTSLLDGSRHEPPRAINFAGGGDFRQIGDNQVAILVARAGLSEHDRVLDIGCGIGRIAMALHRRFPHLEYSGFDIVSYGIDWVRKALEDAQSYEFQHADVANSFYNPRGKISPAGYRFPHVTAGHDLAFGTSVFTHMLESTVRNYLSEISRCLAKGGRAYLTTFILDEVQDQRAAYAFRTRSGLAAIASEHEPEMAVAYSLAAWREMANASSLAIERVFNGSWRGDGPADDFQDAVLLRKVTCQEKGSESEAEDSLASLSCDRSGGAPTIF